MDIDEHIDLINTLGDMLGQKEESKRDKFIDTMPTIIQTHLITEKTWAETTEKVKELEHIIRKCDPPEAALPTLAKGTTVPGLYSHIAHSDDKDEMDIPQPLKGACPKQPKSRDRGKGKQPQPKLKNLPPQTQMNNTIMRILTIITIMRIIEVNPEDVDPIEAKIQVISSEAKIFMAEANEIKIHTKANIKKVGYQSNNYQGNQGFYHNPHRNFSQGSSYGYSRGRSHGHSRGNYCGCGHCRSNY